MSQSLRHGGHVVSPVHQLPGAESVMISMACGGIWQDQDGPSGGPKRGPQKVLKRPLYRPLGILCRASGGAAAQGKAQKFLGAF